MWNFIDILFSIIHYNHIRTERIDLTNTHAVQSFAPESILQHWSTIALAGMNYQRQLVVRLNISEPITGNYRLILNADHPDAIYNAAVKVSLYKKNAVNDDLITEYVDDIEDDIINGKCIYLVIKMRLL